MRIAAAGVEMKGSAARGGEMKGRRGSPDPASSRMSTMWSGPLSDRRRRREEHANRILHHAVILCSPRGTRRAATAVTARNSRVVQVGPVALSEGSERDLIRASDYPGARRVLRFDCAGRSGRE